MHLKRLELNGFKSFAHRSEFIFDVPIIAIVGPNGSGKSNVVEAIRFVLGEQSVKSMRGKTGSDLIFKGSKEIGKRSRATVFITFDNRDRVFSIGQQDGTSIDVDFDEITIGREVIADGTSSYTINGTEVRMKDVHELIASVNIGASGHHIISQGEADRYLNANAKDRRTLIEEALGLKVYQYRIKESLRKLERAQDNLRESELLRREIAPHLRFLKRQVEKIEQAKEVREQLLVYYTKYFAREESLVGRQSRELLEQSSVLTQALSETRELLERHKPQEAVEPAPVAALRKLEDEISELSRKEQQEHREIGRLEGMISVLKQPKAVSNRSSVSYDELMSFKDSVWNLIDNLHPDEPASISTFLEHLKQRILDLVEGEGTAKEDLELDTIQSLEAELARLQGLVADIGSQKVTLREQVAVLEQQLEQARRDVQESQKLYYEYLAKLREYEAQERILSERRGQLVLRQEDHDREYQEARTLLGVDHLTLSQATDSEEEVSVESQNRLLRDIERLKIRLEDMGGGSGIEVINEYQETLERDQFLEREIADVEGSIISLRGIITELTETLNQEFEGGITKINDEFDRFFRLMFGGGHAELKKIAIVKRKARGEGEFEEEESTTDNEPVEHGIDIKVSLPRKKVTDLDMLSGGERSLTSIALLFALSQVNPPPFLVLDETDAALDEANSQKYGDMVEALADFSQLILVTHNRETMSRAQTLFGVTLGRDDASTTLSLRLEDATRYAK